MKKIIHWLITDLGYKIGLCAGAGVIAIGTYAALNSSSEKKEEPKQEVQATSISTDIMLDAMVRAWTDDNGRFLKVCYDAPTWKKYGFFILYGPKKSTTDETLAEGWWYVEQEFFKTSAGKYYTNDIPRLDNNMHVYPDVSGLVCKDR